MESAEYFFRSMAVSTVQSVHSPNTTPNSPQPQPGETRRMEQSSTGV
jgi:hypothetical protein